MSLPEQANTTGTSTGLSWVERLTLTQIEAAAETLWDFAWNSDPNDPWCGKKRYRDASKAARDNYREWARAILLGAERGEPQHTWYANFPDMDYET